MPILTNNATHYRVIRKISGSDLEVGAVIPAEELRTARSLVQLGNVLPCDPPQKSAAPTPPKATKPAVESVAAPTATASKKTRRQSRSVRG